jgi:SAM-dependent methyltransferase
MAVQPSRPFYGEYAWAFDLLIDRPVGQECAAITAWLSDRGVLPGATLLDAGCGTGRYARELARRHATSATELLGVIEAHPNFNSQDPSLTTVIALVAKSRADGNRTTGNA